MARRVILSITVAHPQVELLVPNYASNEDIALYAYQAMIRAVRWRWREVCPEYEGWTKPPSSLPDEDLGGTIIKHDER